MITAVIFDMDGVIADSEYFNIKAKHVILHNAGVEVDWHYHDKFLGTTHEYMWTKMKEEFPQLKEEVRYYIDLWVKTRKELIKEEGLKPMPGVVDLIHGLKEKDLKLAVASSSLKEDIMENMDTFGITDCFDAFVSGSECENGKPDPEIFLKAAKALGKDPKECTVVEDSTAGVAAAKAAGMRCIGYAPEDAVKQDIHLADQIVTEFNEDVIRYITE
jgi:HAD superfamily hydrolase (TIGR01509 family)